jgi:uncharacterized protein (DUF1810 family)
MTLFGKAAPEEVEFRKALDTFFAAQADPLTLEKLSAA